MNIPVDGNIHVQFYIHMYMNNYNIIIHARCVNAC